MRHLLSLLALTACASSQEAGPVAFDRTEIDVGGTPYGLVAADLTGDGRTDLAVADQEGGRVVVLAAEVGGRFRRVDAAGAGADPGGLAAANFDEDGRLDLAVANHETDHLTLLRGTGGGRLEPMAASPLRVDVAPHPHVVAAADLNEDGHADLVVDHREAEGLLLLFGRGDGTFRPGGTVVMGGDPYRGVEVVDLDGDGHLDLVTPNERAVGVRLGAGDGTFPGGSEVDVAPMAPFAVAVADVDGDGVPDLGAGAGEGSSDVAVLLGDGAGGFRPAPGSPHGAAPGAKSMDAADLDGDGTADLAVASWSDRELTLLFGGAERLRRHTVEAGENPWGVTAADLDGDGTSDLATANYGAGSVTVLLVREPG